MKSNLDKLFKTDKNLEQNGIWFEISPTTRFLIKRFHGDNPNVKAAIARYYKPYARLVENGSLDKQKEKEIMTKVFVESSMLDWAGVEIDGKEIPFTKDDAIKLLMSLPELSESLLKYASDYSNYKEDLGNS